MATIAELDPILPRLKDSSNLVEGKRLLHPASRDISPQQLVLARRLMATNEAGTSVYLTRREIERLCLGGQIEFYDKPGYEPKEKGYLISGITNGIKGIVNRIGLRELYKSGDSPNLDLLLDEMAKIRPYRGMDYTAIKAVCLRKGDDDCAGLFSNAYKWLEQNQPLGCPILVPAVSVLETKGDQLSSSVVAEPVERLSLSPEQLRKLMSEPDLIHPQALTDAQAAFLALRMWFLSKEYGAVAHESFGSIPHKIEDIKGLRVDPKEVTDLRGALIEYSRRPWLVLSRNQGCGPQLYLLAQLKGIKQTLFDPYFSRFLGVGSLEEGLLRYVQKRPRCSRLQKSAK